MEDYSSLKWPGALRCFYTQPSLDLDNKAELGKVSKAAVRDSYRLTLSLAFSLFLPFL